MTEPTSGVALVTGGARRIGAAISRALHGAGMRVVVHYNRSRESAEALCSELEATRPGSAIAIHGDLLEAGAPRRLVTAAVAAFGRLDTLVNNASSFYPTPLDALDERMWDDLVGTNLKAPLLLIQAAERWLSESGGSVVNLADIHAERPLPGHAVYGAAKAGLVMVTRVLARDLAPRVRVNAVAPGAILWPEPEPEPHAQERLLAGVPLGRLGEPADIARAVRYLALEAHYTTGHVLTVDGGRAL
ncbi:MAG: pteridine reductase [Ectothiorhodospiraceae bacterium]|nr:pteridine reductase [Chromatiales bacterium]MCP5157349.1 pteridine reductase [Ectothiorhodospiraceae bacterium]